MKIFCSWPKLVVAVLATCFCLESIADAQMIAQRSNSRAQNQPGGSSSNKFGLLASAQWLGDSPENLDSNVRPASCDMDTCCGGCDSCVGGCDSSCPPGCTCCECCEPWWAHRSGLYGEFLYWQLADGEVTHAQQQDGIGGAGTVPFGIIQNTNHDHEPGFRVGFDIAYSGCSSIFGNYTFLENETEGLLVPPTITGGGGAVGSFVHHPGAAITASTGPVGHLYDVDFQLADFGLRRVWKAGCNHVINWSVGGRYGHLEQDFDQLGHFAGGQQGTIDTYSNIRFDGGGLLFGLDAERRAACSGWSVYGKIFVTPLTGRFHADYTMLNTTTDALLAQAIWQDDRIVTLLDYEAGLAWTSQCNHWRLSAGYAVSHWFNAVTSDSFIEAVTTNDYVNVEGPLSFSGLTSKIEYSW